MEYAFEMYYFLKEGKLNIMPDIATNKNLNSRLDFDLAVLQLELHLHKVIHDTEAVRQPVEDIIPSRTGKNPTTNQKPSNRLRKFTVSYHFFAKSSTSFLLE